MTSTQLGTGLFVALVVGVRLSLVWRRIAKVRAAPRAPRADDTDHGS